MKGTDENNMKIIDVARYLIFLSEKNEDLINPFKLNKVLYYAKGFHYLWESELLFEEEFEAWKYGAVNVEIYEYFKKYGTSSQIPYFEGSNLDIREKEKTSLEAVYRSFKKENGYQISRCMSWEKPYKDGLKKEDKIITNDMIMEYYDKDNY